MREQQMRVPRVPSETCVPREGTGRGIPWTVLFFFSEIHACSFCLMHKADGSSLTCVAILLYEARCWKEDMPKGLGEFGGRRG